MFPSLQTMFEPGKIEEERRLCYVAITRARERLYITNAVSRMLYGQTTRNRPSQFLRSIPDELKQETKKTTYRAWGGTDFGAARTGGSSYGGDYGRSPVRQSYDSSVMPAYEDYSQDLPAAARSSWVAPKPKPEAPATVCEWQVGDTVKHAAFGVGVVEASAPMGNDVMLTIAFEKVGTKKIMGKYSKLEKA